MSLRYYTHGRRDQNKVALTFDDGPNPPRTDQVLEILESRGARARHFLCWASGWSAGPKPSSASSGLGT